LREANPNQGASGVGSVIKKGHLQRDCKQKKDGDDKGKEKDSAYVTGSDESDALILFLTGSSESWVIDAGASFHATSVMKSFKIM